MKVSVIIPNYCHARFLNRRIDSVLNQTYGDFEVIILDDCSTDNSRDIIETYRHHPRVSHIVYNEKNSGSTFIQWDKGFELAQGEYIWIAESDDEAAPTFLEECVGQLEKHPSATIAFSDCLFVDENTRDLCEPKLQLSFRLSDKNLDTPYTLFNGRAFINHRMFYQNYIMNASMVVFRKEARPHDFAYKCYRYVGDWLFWVGILLQGDAVYVDKPLDYFRQHGKNTTSKSIATGNNYKEMAHLMQDICRQVNPPRGFIHFLYGRFFVRIKRLHKGVEYTPKVIREIYAYWAQIENPVKAIVWYRIAKILHIYRDEKPYLP